MQSKELQSDLTLRLKTIRRTFRMPINLDNQIKAITDEEVKNYTDISLALLQRGMKQYIHKKGTFYCQRCKQQNSNKKMHLVPIGFEEFIFCDNCFFSDGWKDFVREIL